VIILSHMSSDLDPVFKALADPSRRKLLDLLKDAPKTTGELCNAFSLTRYGVMRHIAVLEEAKLITVRRKGRERWNYLNTVPIQSLYQHYVKPYEEQWTSTLSNLKQYVEVKEESVFGTESVLNIDIAQDITIEMPIERVFAALTQEMSNWWSPQHMSKNALGIVLEPKLGGRFYEIWRGGDIEEQDSSGRLLGEVSLFQPNKRLEIVGRLHLGVVQGVMDFELEQKTKKTTILHFSHKAFGDIEADAEPKFAKGWNKILAVDFKTYVEPEKISNSGSES